VLAVVDREHGASERLEEEGVECRHLFTSAELGIVEHASGAGGS
jgi:hypothetical protein